LAALHCLVLLVLATPRLSLSQASPEEYTVKAAFLFHFAQLVDWPEGALDAAAPSLNLCIFEDEPHRQEFQRTIEGKLVGSRVLHLHLLAQAQDINGCNLLFLSRRELRRQSAILDSLRGQPVLTVGETDSFLSDGGMIRFRLDRDKVRFDINLAAADSAHLKISSRLLLLASVAGPGNGADRAR
jgi:hypothetical protein